MAKEILCGFGIDVDAVAGWLGSYGGEDSPDDISRGLFAGEVGSPRLLKLFARLGIKTTWFIPGHSIETFPTEMKAVAEAGNEIGIQGYSHENPIAMTREQEMAVLDKCIELVTQLSTFLRPPAPQPSRSGGKWIELSVPLDHLPQTRGLLHHPSSSTFISAGGTASYLRSQLTRHARFVADSPLKGDGFDLSVLSAYRKTLEIQPFLGEETKGVLSRVLSQKEGTKKTPAGAEFCG